MTFRPINDASHLYFVTATICGWKRIFKNAAMIQIIVDSLKWHCENGRMELFVFVIMPNHLHFICRPLHPYEMSSLKQSFGSFTAHAILKELRRKGKEEWLSFFREKASEAGQSTS